MRALSILPSSLRGGVEEYALNINSAAVKEGWDVHVAFAQTEGTASLIGDFTAKGVHYHQLEIAEVNVSRWAGIGRHLPWFARTVYLLLKLKPDVVQVNLPYPAHCLGSILACGLLQVPTAVVFHFVPCKQSYNPMRLKAYAWARARNQQWITVSENNRKLVCESFQIPEHEILCIYNGTKLISTTINSDREERNRLRHQVRQELGVSETARLALTVGRLAEQKGYGDLVPVIPHIVKEFPDVRFVWVGEGEQREYLVSQVREYGVEDKVLFLGQRSDVPVLLKSADIFVFPTHSEGHPLSLLEAMAHSLPIVTSDASGIPEVIENKIHGLLFRTGDSRDLLEAISLALGHSDKMQEMARNAQLRVQDFSEDKMIKETLGVWQSLSCAF